MIALDRVTHEDLRETQATRLAEVGLAKPVVSNFAQRWKTQMRERGLGHLLDGDRTPQDPEDNFSNHT